MAGYPYDYGSRYTTNMRDSNEVNISSLETKLSDLTSLVIQLVCKEAQHVRRCGPHMNNGYPINTYPTSQHGTEQAYTYGGFSSPNHNIFKPYSSSYDHGWQSYPISNEYGYEWYDNSYPSYESTPPATENYSGDSGMSLEEIVKSLTLSTLEFQQETRVSLQNLENQICQNESSIRRLEAKIEEKLGLMKRPEISLEEEDEEKDTSLSTSRDGDKKGEDVAMMEMMVVPPSFPTPLVDFIKEEKFVDTGGTFTMLKIPKDIDKKGNLNEDTFAELQKEILLERKGFTLEIQTNFKAPQHHVKTHVWGIDLLDTG